MVSLNSSPDLFHVLMKSLLANAKKFSCKLLAISRLSLELLVLKTSSPLLFSYHLSSEQRLVTLTHCQYFLILLNEDNLPAKSDPGNPHNLHMPEEEAGTEQNFKTIFGYVRICSDLDLKAWSSTEIREREINRRNDERLSAQFNLSITTTLSINKIIFKKENILQTLKGLVWGELVKILMVSSLRQA
ncbi:hypothetical protein TURU_037425 [Turdus rufiventris]|nr:hypothetical protein TURU_037425 [Turdus rufiventris]